MSESFTAVTKNEMLVHVITQVNFVYITQAKEARQMIPFIWCSRIGKVNL